MKAILYFVNSGRVRDSHKEAATAINKATGKRVVFRNGTTAESTGENPEPNEGVAGRVPSTYAGATVYGDNGKVITKAAPLSIVDTPQGAPGKFNDLGLPKGAPNDRGALKAALEAEGVEFHPSAPTTKLVILFKEHFLKEEEQEEQEETED